jgi:hypothetical protein
MKPKLSKPQLKVLMEAIEVQGCSAFEDYPPVTEEGRRFLQNTQRPAGES